MHRGSALLLGSLLFAVGGCSSANPAGTGADVSRGSTWAGATTDSGSRLVGGEPIGALVVETVPSVRPAPAGAPPAQPSPPAWSSSTEGVGNAREWQGSFRPPPPPPPPPRLPASPAGSRGPPPPPPPPPPAVASSASATGEAAPGGQPPAYLEGGDPPPPMPRGPRSDSGVLGAPPSGALPLPEAHHIAR